MFYLGGWMRGSWKGGWVRGGLVEMRGFFFVIDRGAS